MDEQICIIIEFDKNIQLKSRFLGLAEISDWISNEWWKMPRMNWKNKQMLLVIKKDKNHIPYYFNWTKNSFPIFFFQKQQKKNNNNNGMKTNF